MAKRGAKRTRGVNFILSTGLRKLCDVERWLLEVVGEDTTRTKNYFATGLTFKVDS